MAELLAPGGRLDMVYAAVKEGADAVYVGPLGWSRRPYESEMSDADIQEAIRFARKGGSSIRVVVNTYPSPFEMEAYLDRVRRFADWGADGFIVTDPGAIGLIRNSVPDAIIHVSVGAGITNAEDAACYREMGADLIVLPYRWGVEEIARVKAVSDIGIETFLFETVQTGKICPGRCTMSSYLKFRDWREEEGKDWFHGSANRGAKECYRVCQKGWAFSYEEAESIRHVLLRSDARLMLEQLPEYVALGVDCFKISGRERPTPIIRDLVRFYRRALDRVQEDPREALSGMAEEMQALQQRWVQEKRKRVDVLMGRAQAYGDKGTQLDVKGHDIASS